MIWLVAVAPDSGSTSLPALMATTCAVACGANAKSANTSDPREPSAPRSDEAGHPQRSVDSRVIVTLERSGLEHLPQHVRQNAAVAVVFHFLAAYPRARSRENLLPAAVFTARATRILRARQ